MVPKVKEVKALEAYIIFIRFEDGTEGNVDLSHLAGKGIFKHWDDYNNFQKVYIDEESNAIAWNEMIDLDPLNLYLKLKNLSIDSFLNLEYASN